MTNINPDMTAGQYTDILIAELIKTDGFKSASRAFIHEMLNNWAGESGLKKWITPSIEKQVQKSLAGPDTGKSATARDITTLTAPIIALVNDLLNQIEKTGKTLDEMDGDKTQALIEAIVSNVNFGKLAELSGPIIRAITRVREENPAFLADIFRERLTAGVNELDFNSAATFLSVSQNDLTALSRIINDALWQSSDRLMEALTIIPAGINLLAKALGEFLFRFSKLKTEDITDIFLQLLDQVDGESLGALLNANALINHKIVKGTRAFRDPDTDIPSSENVLMRKMEEIAGNMDPNLIFNLRLSLEEMKVPFREWLMSDS